MSTSGLKTKSADSQTNLLVETFIATLADKYGITNGITVSDLKDLWVQISAGKLPKDLSLTPRASPKGSPVKRPFDDAADTLTEQLQKTSLTSSEELSKLSVKELASHCKARKLKVSGTKQELIERLTGKASTPVAAATVVKSKPATKKRKGEPETPKVIKNIQSYIQTIKITRNTFGNFQHEETGLVFDKISKQVVGKQNPNGNVDMLTVEDIELCNKFKFKYILPDNLNAFKKANTVVIEELEEDGIETDEVKTEEGENEEEEFLEEEDEEVEEDVMEEDEGDIGID